MAGPCFGIVSLRSSPRLLVPFLSIILIIVLGDPASLDCAGVWPVFQVLIAWPEFVAAVFDLEPIG